MNQFYSHYYPLIMLVSQLVVPAILALLQASGVSAKDPQKDYWVSVDCYSSDIKRTDNSYSPAKSSWTYADSALRYDWMLTFVTCINNYNGKVSLYLRTIRNLLTKTKATYDAGSGRVCT